MRRGLSLSSCIDVAVFKGQRTNYSPFHKRSHYISYESQVSHCYAYERRACFSVALIGYSMLVNWIMSANVPECWHSNYPHSYIVRMVTGMDSAMDQKAFLKVFSAVIVGICRNKG